MCWGAVLLLQPSETKLAVLFLASPFADYDDNDCDGDAERELLYLLYSSPLLASLTAHIHVNLSLSFPLCFSSSPQWILSASESVPTVSLSLSLSLWIFLPNRLSYYSVFLPTDLLLLLPLPLLPLYSMCVIISGDSPLSSCQSVRCQPLCCRRWWDDLISEWKH